MEEPQQGSPGQFRSPRAYLGLGFEIAVPVVLFMYLGYKLDSWLDSEPWLLGLGAVLGVSVGFFSFFRRVLPARDVRSEKKD